MIIPWYSLQDLKIPHCIMVIILWCYVAPHYFWGQMDLIHYNIQLWFNYILMISYMSEMSVILSDVIMSSVSVIQVDVWWFLWSVILRLREWLPYVTWKTTQSPLRGNWVTCLLLNLFFLAPNKEWLFRAGYRRWRNTQPVRQNQHTLVCRG